MSVTRFAAETREGRWTVVDHDRQCIAIHAPEWSEETARQLADELERGELHPSIFNWEEDSV